MIAPQNILTTSRDNGVIEIVLNRPEARNALNLELCNLLIDTFESLAGDTESRAVIVRAEGPVFCAGADRRERKDKDEAWVIARRQASFRAYAAIEACPIPVICAVQGPVVGSGGEIAMACDFIVAVDTATFTFPEPQLGTVGATQRLQRRIGVSRAKELLFTGRKMPADEACALGMVAQVVGADDLTKTVREIAEKIASAPSLAMRLTKQCIDQGSKTDLTTGIAIEMAAIRQVLHDCNWRDGFNQWSPDKKKV